MDKEQLQKTIAEYYSKLPKEAQGVFSSMEWMGKLKDIATKYVLDEDQLEILATETTLVLLGIIHVEEYQKTIEAELKLAKEITDKIITEIDENILKTIKEQLIATFGSNSMSLTEKEGKETIIINKPFIPDPHFVNMPKNVQEAIGNSNWKERLYKIAQKYKLTVEQMGILEEITIKVMRDEIHPDKYEDELTSKITTSKENISNLVNDINENVLKAIRELLKNPKATTEEMKNKEEIPLPPYSKPETKIEIPKTVEATIETMHFPTKKVEIPKILESIKPIEPMPATLNVSKNIIEEKLKGATASDHIISDYSIPKISSSSPDVQQNNPNPLPRSSDPYREAF